MCQDQGAADSLKEPMLGVLFASMAVTVLFQWPCKGLSIFHIPEPNEIQSIWESGTLDKSTGPS